MHRATYIPLPAERVFEFLLEADNAKRVMSGVSEFRQLDEGPVQLGTRFAQTRVVNGVSATAVARVVDFDAPRRLALRGGAKGVEVEFRYTLLPAPGGTRVELTCDVEGKGVMKVFNPLILQFVEREEGAHLDRLAEVLGPTALPPAARRDSPGEAIQ